MLSYSLKTLLRSPLKTLLWLLALTLTGVTLCLSTGLFATTLINADRLSDSYVSTAYVEPAPDLPLKTKWGYSGEGFTVLKKSLVEIADAGGIGVRDNRNLYYGSSPELKPVTEMAEAGYSKAAFIIEAVGEKDLDGNPRTDYRIEEILAIHPEHADVYEKLKLTYSKYDLRVAMAGKRYLVVGELAYVDPGPIDGQYFRSDLRVEAEIIGFDSEKQDNIYSARLYELTGTLEEFYATAQGEKVRRYVGSLARLMNSVPVLTTDRAESLPVFNTGKALLLSGRWITPEEYASGAKVCIMSSALAGKNGWEAGDTVSLGFSSADAWQNYAYWTDRSMWTMDYPVWDETPTPQETFTIVGTYSGLKNTENTDEFSTNTVIIPDAAVDMPTSVFYENAIMAGYIIENGRLEEFQKAIDEAIPKGGGEALPITYRGTPYKGSDYFLMLDQGYSDMEAFFTAMRFNSAIVMLVGVGAYLAVIVLYFTMFVLRRRREAGMLHSIGASGTSVGFELFVSSALPVVIAGVISAFIAYKLYAASFALVTELSLDNTVAVIRFSDVAAEGARSLLDNFTEQPNSVFLSAAAELVLSLIAALVLSAVTAAANPLKLMRSEVK